MAAEILDVKSFVRNWKKEMRSSVQRSVEAGKRTPSLTIVQVGDNPASTKYVDNKIKDCKEVGVRVELYRIPEGAGLDQEALNGIVYDAETDGILIQLPLPQGLNGETALGYTVLSADVDGFMPGSPHNPATAKGIITYLGSLGLEDGSGKNALVIGRSKIVGRPVAKMLLDRNWTVTVAHSKTDRTALCDMIKNVDLIICAVGKQNFLDAQLAKKGAVIIDVGTNWDGNKLVGDVFNHDKSEALITPVPGGVGLLTRAALISNVLEAWNNGDNL
jgi:methylenetetrahydrofolate dehydrogenase (NADP+)/methenyltetrahydrofolate cyclohydrolase